MGSFGATAADGLVHCADCAHCKVVRQMNVRQGKGNYEKRTGAGPDRLTP